MEKAFPQAKFVMLATTPEWNKANYTNYMSQGFPVRNENGDGYVFIKMVDVDHPDHDDDDFDFSVGSKAVWDRWTFGTKEFVGYVLKSGKRSKSHGHSVSVSGGYGEDKRTLVGVLPPYFGNKTIK